MDVLAGPFIAAAALLGLAGASKLRRPAPTGAALRALGLPGGALLVRIGAVVELGVAAAAVAFGDRLSAALVAASYLAFTLFVLAAMRRNVPLSSCGCFGRPDTPPSPAHVVVNLTFAAVAGSMAGAPVGGLANILDAQPMFGIPFLAMTGVAVALAYLSLTVLPSVLALASGRSR